MLGCRLLWDHMLDHRSSYAWLSVIVGGIGEDLQSFK